MNFITRRMLYVAIHTTIPSTKGMAQAAEDLPSKHEALSSKPRIAKKKKNQKTKTQTYSHPTPKQKFRKSTPQDRRNQPSIVCLM
jgi:hypothetical protein